MDKQIMREAILCPEYKPARQRIDELQAENAALKAQLAAAQATIANMREALRIVELCVPPAQRAIVREAIALPAIAQEVK